MFTMADVKNAYADVVERESGFGIGNQESDIWDEIDEAMRQEHGYNLAFYKLPLSTPLGPKTQAAFAKLQTLPWCQDI